MTPLNCPNCGAPVKPYAERCSYCGSTFKWEEGHRFPSRITLIKEHPAVIPVSAKIMLDRWDYPPELPKELMAEKVKYELTQRIVRELLPEIEFYKDFDIENMKDVYTARLRIVRKGERLF